MGSVNGLLNLGSSRSLAVLLFYNSCIGTIWILYSICVEFFFIAKNAKNAF